VSEDQWTAVDRYLEERLAKDDDALEHALKESAAAGLPEIAVSANQGRLLSVLAGAVNATRILEMGTLGGYSTIWMARALQPGGKLVTIEGDARHAEVARANLDYAGLADQVEVWIGLVADRLPQIAASSPMPFDFTFIDADKANIPEYFDWAVKMSRPGSLIVIDNVIRHGRILRDDTGDADVDGVRRFFDAVSSDDRVEVVALQTVGIKGYDGLSIARVRDSR